MLNFGRTRWVFTLTTSVRKTQTDMTKQEEWVALIEKQDADKKLTADCTWEEFLGSITRVKVGFKSDNGAVYVHTFLNEGLEILSKDDSAYERIEIRCIPAICNYDFLVYIPAKNVPLEFIKKYVEMHKK